MTGPSEEIGKTSRDVIAALGGQPALIALIVMQLLTLGIIAWSVHERNLTEGRLNEMLISLCKRGACVACNIGGTEGRS